MHRDFGLGPDTHAGGKALIEMGAAQAGSRRHRHRDSCRHSVNRRNLAYTEDKTPAVALD